MSQTLKTLFGILPAGAKYTIARVDVDSGNWETLEKEEVEYDNLYKFSNERVFAIIPTNTMEFEIRTMGK